MKLTSKWNGVNYKNLDLSENHNFIKSLPRFDLVWNSRNFQSTSANLWMLSKFASIMWNSTKPISFFFLGKHSTDAKKNPPFTYLSCLNTEKLGVTPGVNAVTMINAPQTILIVWLNPCLHRPHDKMILQHSVDQFLISAFNRGCYFRFSEDNLISTSPSRIVAESCPYKICCQVPLIAWSERLLFSHSCGSLSRVIFVSCFTLM